MAVNKFKKSAGLPSMAASNYALTRTAYINNIFKQAGHQILTLKHPFSGQINLCEKLITDKKHFFI